MLLVTIRNFRVDILFLMYHASISHCGIIGLAYLGVVLSSILYGISCIQTFSYYMSQRAASDRRPLKFLVAFVGILDSAHQALVIYAVYYYVVLEFANPLAILIVVWSIPTSILIVLFVGVSVQAFRISRIWSLSNNIWATGFCGLVKAATLGSGIVFPVKQCDHNRPAKRFPLMGLSLVCRLLIPSSVVGLTKLRSTGIGALSIAFAGDMIVALAMTYYLCKKRTGLKRSNDQHRSFNDMYGTGQPPCSMTPRFFSRVTTADNSNDSLLVCFGAADAVQFVLQHVDRQKYAIFSFDLILNTREFVNNPMHMKTNELSSFVREEMMHKKTNELASLAIRPDAPPETNSGSRRQQSVIFVISRHSDSGIFSVP
ncbi:hypothetical protein NM688_g6624 [Phlebia brevispora]|uniref:Uncharacterized protein n=1 Tax=Phlebia brevispora TaxID=194682 RepID=A0ACC1SEB7_9APHY|nr:hypothetical protein NM688_g6624 [Phlebia brevispora]